MDLVPAFTGGRRARPVLRRGDLGPTCAVRGDLLAGGLAQTVPQVPAVGDLDRVGQRAADGFGVGA
jgi:hypothetical protein